LQIYEIALISAILFNAKLYSAKQLILMAIKNHHLMTKAGIKIQKEKPREVLLLAKRIKQLRKERGYSSQEAFAYDNNYTLSYYSRLERGEDIRFTSLVRVCNALNVDLKTFFSQGF
jgi:DNA-binding Xre family transcriptional regulator